jgi:PadR family transcriptional regulator PadR
MPAKNEKFDDLRLTHQGLLVLKAFVQHSTKELTGADLMKLAGLASGTVYPILLRFERAGVLESEWESIDPKEEARPRRRYYTLTPRGAAFARQVLSSLSVNASVPVLNPA